MEISCWCFKIKYHIWIYTMQFDEFPENDKPNQIDWNNSQKSIDKIEKYSKIEFHEWVLSYKRNGLKAIIQCYRSSSVPRFQCPVCIINGLLRATWIPMEENGKRQTFHLFTQFSNIITKNPDPVVSRYIIEFHIYFLYTLHCFLLS